MGEKLRPAAVSVLGLGNMGSALARAFIAEGHRVTVWNRSEARSRGLADRCRVAVDPADACRGVDLIVACLANYQATRDTLGGHEVREALAGRTLVQLATGTPTEAQRLGAWAREAGASYLDGKIAVTPGRIGDDLTVIFYAGSKADFDTHQATLRSLGGRPTYVGDDVGRASLADFAFLSFYFAGILGILHGAAFCKAADLDLDQFFGAMPSFTAEMIARLPSFRDMISSGDFTQAQSTLKVDLAGARLLAQVAERTGLAPRFPAFLVEMFESPVGGGLGEADTAALTEVFLKAELRPQRP
jgi:3-hydroxyisobutyrate dehydrogenase-like beta-hydroxyacid dehydrogenase